MITKTLIAIGRRSVVVAGLLLANVVSYSTAQEIPKRMGRFGVKPGEVITRPDLSQRWRDELKVGQIAPEFTLPLLKRENRNPTSELPHAALDTEVSLKKLRAHKPVVLIFGSITCPPFRNQLDGIDDVYDNFRDRVEFLFVYVREAHPDSILSLADNQGSESLQKIPQATDASQRTQAAAYCQKSLELKLPIAVDTIDNRIGQVYAGWPNRMVVVDTTGKIIFASEPSPGGADAKKLRVWLTTNIGQ